MIICSTLCKNWYVLKFVRTGFATPRPRSPIRTELEISDHTMCNFSDEKYHTCCCCWVIELWTIWDIILNVQGPYESHILIGIGCVFFQISSKTGTSPSFSFSYPCINLQNVNISLFLNFWYCLYAPWLYIHSYPYSV